MHRNSPTSMRVSMETDAMARQLLMFDTVAPMKSPALWARRTINITAHLKFMPQGGEEDDWCHG